MPLPTMEMMSECSKRGSESPGVRLEFEHFDVFSVVGKSADHGKLLSIH